MNFTSKFWKTVILLFVYTAMSGFLLSSNVQAASCSINVTTLDDEYLFDGDCSLREAISSVNNGYAVDNCSYGSSCTSATIYVPAGTITITLEGPSEDNNLTGDFDIKKPLAIIGSKTGMTILEGNKDTGVPSDKDRMFEIIENGHSADYYFNPARFENIIIQNAFCHGCHGGGFYISDQVSVIIANCAILTNKASFDGGGIYNLGIAHIINTTISGNIAQGGFGGGIENYNRNDNQIYGTLNLYGSSIINNYANNACAGLSIADCTIYDSIIAENVVGLSGSYPDICATNITEAGNVLISNTSSDYDFTSACNSSSMGFACNVDAKIDEIADNGGNTFTHALNPDSVAINAGDCGTSYTYNFMNDTELPHYFKTDQRLYPRGSTCDLGAYEFRLGSGGPCESSIICESGYCVDSVCCKVGDCENGTCGSGGNCDCNTGWIGNPCDSCADNYYGSSCTPCPACVNGSCNDDLEGDGTCVCENGWDDELCDKCEDDYYGDNCTSCPACVNGSCNDGLEGDGTCACTNGWTGTLCDLEEADGDADFDEEMDDELEMAEEDNSETVDGDYDTSLDGDEEQEIVETDDDNDMDNEREMAEEDKSETVDGDYDTHAEGDENNEDESGEVVSESGCQTTKDSSVLLFVLVASYLVTRKRKKRIR